MKIEIDNLRIQEIIHNIAEDFRFSSEHERYAQLFYAMDIEKYIDKKMHTDALEYIQVSKKELKESINWKEAFQKENPQVDKAKMLHTMKIIAQEYQELETYLVMLNIK
jgi:hypothetical protein